MSNNEKLVMARIYFWLNGRQLSLEVPPGMTTLELLNDKLSLHGTKSSCNEGDCGACTVIIASRNKTKTGYQTINSCLYPAFRLHGKHLITVEGISADASLHPVQTALLDEHGTQCGFCTPGFVMSMLGLFLNNPQPSDAEILTALEGNLCRCTGYDSIFKAAKLLRERLDAKAELLPASLRKVEKLLKTVPEVSFIAKDNYEGWSTLRCYLPANLEELWQTVKAVKQEGNYKFLAGGTDLMVLANTQRIHSRSLIELGGISELDGIVLHQDGLLIGANVTYTQLRQDKNLIRLYPLLGKAIEQIASVQIRNSATLAGNIAHASPVADGATTLLALKALIVISSAQKDRVIPLADFYQGYKQTQLKPAEIIRAVLLPLPSEYKHYSGFIKSAKRKSMDISGVVSALEIQYENGKIIDATLSFGGVAAYPALAKQAMASLKGKKIDVKLVEKAAAAASREFTPISDIRGSEHYRSLLIRNHVIKHLNSFFASLKPAGRRS